MFTLEEFYLEHKTLLQVLIGMVLCSTSTAVVGTFNLLQRRSLTSDAVAHALLPGLCLGFLLATKKNPVWLIVGAGCTGSLAFFLISFLTVQSKIKKDLAIALVLSIFFGVGLLLIKYVQNTGRHQQLGLQNFLIGHVGGLMPQDIYLFGALAFITIVVVLLLYKEFVLLSFDVAYAATLGCAIKPLQALLNLLTIAAILVSIPAVGIMLVSALLMLPSTAARFWTTHCKHMIRLSVLFAVLASILGVMASYLLPLAPTGPCVILALSVIVLCSFFLSPNKGLLAQHYKLYRYRQKVLKENLLKLLYEAEEKAAQPLHPFSLAQLQSIRFIPTTKLRKGLLALQKERLVAYERGGWLLTTVGKERGAHILRLHLLWEAYLTTHLTLKAEQIHQEAELVEHVMTTKIAERLGELLPEV